MVLSQHLFPASMAAMQKVAICKFFRMQKYFSGFYKMNEPILINTGQIKLLFCTLIILIFNFSSIFSQCQKENFAFRSGEHLEYNIVYNWHMVWMEAGGVTFITNPSHYNGSDSYECTVIGTTHKNFDWFYKVRDWFRCYIDSATLRPLRYDQHSQEGKKTTSCCYIFDDKKGVINSTVSTNLAPLHYDTLKNNGCIYDIVSVVNYIRNFNFTGYSSGNKFEVQSLIDGEIHSIPVTFLGRETLKTHDGHTYQCFKVSARLVEGTIFKAGENVVVWISDDDNHIAILVEAKIIVGSVKAVLKNTDNLKNPFSSKIN